MLYFSEALLSSKMGIELQASARTTPCPLTSPSMRSWYPLRMLAAKPAETNLRKVKGLSSSLRRCSCKILVAVHQSMEAGSALVVVFPSCFNVNVTLTTFAVRYCSKLGLQVLVLKTWLGV